MIETVKKIRGRSGNVDFAPVQDLSAVTQFQAQIQAHFSDLFASSARTIALPNAFVGFLQYFGEGYAYLSGAPNVFLWDWKDIIRETEMITAADYIEGKSAREEWLVIGEHSDKHWYYLCCDATSPSFGCVADGEDTSPWNLHSAVDIYFKSFSEFLEFLCNRNEE